MSSMKNLATLLIWYGLTICTLLVIAFSDYLMAKGHYINLGLLLFATLSFFLGYAYGQVSTVLMLIIGMFAGGLFLNVSPYLNLWGIQLHLPYLPLIIFFLVVNRENLISWTDEIFHSEEKTDKK